MSELLLQQAPQLPLLSQVERKDLSNAHAREGEPLLSILTRSTFYRRG